MIRTDLIAPIAELLERQARRFPDRIAFTDAKRTITYAELDRATRNLATWLRKTGGSSVTVGIWLPNSVEWVIACLATVRAGGIAVPVSYDAMKSEVAYRLEDAQCSVVVTMAEKAGELEDLASELPGGIQPILVGEPRDPEAMSFDSLCASRAVGVELTSDDIDATSYIVYTSGTTGKPKGVSLSSRAVLWSTAACWTPILGFDEDDYVLSPLPLFHSYALTITVLSVLATGARVYIMERFSTQRAIELLRSGEFTLMPGVPTMFHYLMVSPEAQDGELFSSLRLCITAGAIMPATLTNEFEEKFGIELIDGYGITEMSTMVTMNWPGECRIPGSCGLPIPGLAIRIIDPATGIDVPFGAEGELICRGPNLMLGYNRKPEETAAVIRNGWYHTGDLARSDKHGFLTITGRLKEIIIRGGQNIAPAEVEETLQLLDDVMDCAIVGVGHETLGEVPFAFIVPHEGRTIDAEAVKSHCTAHLSSYKIPAEIRIVSQIPRTGSGKIMRFKLRELVEAS